MIVNLVRFLDIDLGEVLNCIIEKFINRFDFIEKSVMNLNKKLEDMIFEEMDEFWN